MDAYERPWQRDIACRDSDTYDLSGTKIMTVHPEHKKANNVLLAFL